MGALWTGRIKTKICPLLFLPLRPVPRTALLQTIPNDSQLKEQRFPVKPIKADILLTHGRSPLRAGAKDIMDIIH